MILLFSGAHEFSVCMLLVRRYQLHTGISCYGLVHTPRVRHRHSQMQPFQTDKFPLIKILCISIQQGSSGPRETWSNDRLQRSLIKIFIYMNFKVFRLLEKPMKMFCLVLFFNSIGPDLMILSNCQALKIIPSTYNLTPLILQSL